MRKSHEQRFITKEHIAKKTHTHLIKLYTLVSALVTQLLNEV